MGCGQGQGGASRVSLGDIPFKMTGGGSGQGDGAEDIGPDVVLRTSQDPGSGTSRAVLAGGVGQIVWVLGGSRNQGVAGSWTQWIL